MNTFLLIVIVVLAMLQAGWTLGYHRKDSFGRALATTIIIVFIIRMCLKVIE